MACGGNAWGGLGAGMWRGALPEGHAAEAPVWLPHAVIARGHRPSPDPSAPDSLRMIWGSHVRIFSLLVGQPPHGSSTRRPRGPQEVGGCVQVRARASDKRVQIGDRKREIRNEIESDRENSDLPESRGAAASFTF